jgi:hypothetical protein
MLSQDVNDVPRSPERVCRPLEIMRSLAVRPDCRNADVIHDNRQAAFDNEVEQRLVCQHDLSARIERWLNPLPIMNNPMHCRDLQLAYLNQQPGLCGLDEPCHHCCCANVIGVSCGVSYGVFGSQHVSDLHILRELGGSIHEQN